MYKGAEMANFLFTIFTLLSLVLSHPTHTYVFLCRFLSFLERGYIISVMLESCLELILN
jgi:hypothetical protein